MSRSASTSPATSPSAGSALLTFAAFRRQGRRTTGRDRGRHDGKEPEMERARTRRCTAPDLRRVQQHNLSGLEALLALIRLQLARLPAAARIAAWREAMEGSSPRSPTPPTPSTTSSAPRTAARGRAIGTPRSAATGRSRRRGPEVGWGVIIVGASPTANCRGLGRLRPAGPVPAARRAAASPAVVISRSPASFCSEPLPGRPHLLADQLIGVHGLRNETRRVVVSRSESRPIVMLPAQVRPDPCAAAPGSTARGRLQLVDRGVA